MIGGINNAYYQNQPVGGTFTTNINNNTIEIHSNPAAATGADLFGIQIGSNVPMAVGSITSMLIGATLNVNNNTIQNCELGGSTGTGNSWRGIRQLSDYGTVNIQNNLITNGGISTSTSTTGNLFMIRQDGAADKSFVLNNTIRGIYSSSTTTGQVQGIVHPGACLTEVNIKDLHSTALKLKTIADNLHGQIRLLNF